MSFKGVVRAQLARELSTPTSALAGGKNIFTLDAGGVGRRDYYARPRKLHIAALNNIAVFSSSSEELLAACKAKFESAAGEWICESENLRALDELLSREGAQLSSPHICYIPEKEEPSGAERGEAVLLEREALARFAGDGSFSEAVGGSETHPDMLGFAYYEHGRAVALAAASADCEEMWQIGINVLPEFRGRGAATRLVTLLKDEIIRRGKLPFYGTGSSHIVSRRVAHEAGFVPAWWEAVDEPKK